MRITRRLRPVLLDREHYVEPRYTPRLALRQYQARDYLDLIELHNDPKVIRHLTWEPRSLRQSKSHLKARVRHDRLRYENDFAVWAYELHGKVIGDVSLHLRRRDLAEIGWILNSNYWGNGYAAEAAQSIIDFAFTDLGVEFVDAAIRPENAQSIALAKRLGFTQATHRRWFLQRPQETE